jgi:Ca2+-binding EF-hand superfamily protein
MPEQQKFLDETFARYDRSGDGQVTRAEFPGSDAQWRELDLDGNGMVTRAEFAGSATAKRLLLAFANSKKEPRARPDWAALAGPRLRAAMRFDKDRDGRVQRGEWSGAETAFRTLDLNGDGVLDARDKKVADSAAPALDDSDPLRGFALPLPSRDALLKKLDKDKDGTLAAAEVASTDLQAALPRYDKNRDARLDATELQVLIDQVAAAVARRNAGTLGDVPRMPDIAFGAWDKDNDGKLSNAEFEAKEWFVRIDIDRDGFITKEEIGRCKRSLDGAGFIARFDLDDDGRVTLAEFGGAPAVFRRADRNGDGVVNKQDG